MTVPRQPVRPIRNRLTGATVFYTHPAGFRIKRDERDWDARGYPGAGPKVQWVVSRSGLVAVEVFPTLRAARAWCDEQVEEVRKYIREIAEKDD